MAGRSERVHVLPAIEPIPHVGPKGERIVPLQQFAARLKGIGVGKGVWSAVNGATEQAVQATKRLRAALEKGASEGQLPKAELPRPEVRDLPEGEKVLAEVKEFIELTEKHVDTAKVIVNSTLVQAVGTALKVLCDAMVEADKAIRQAEAEAAQAEDDAWKELNAAKQVVQLRKEYEEKIRKIAQSWRAIFSVEAEIELAKAQSAVKEAVLARREMAEKHRQCVVKTASIAKSLETLGKQGTTYALVMNHAI